MSGGFWVREGRSELINLVYNLGHGDYWVHIGWNIGWQLLSTLHLKLHLLELLILVIVHDSGARCNGVHCSGPILIGEVGSSHATFSHLTLSLINLAF